MLGALLVSVGLGIVGGGDYLRPLAAAGFDQATLDAEGFGDKKGLAREADGLKVTVAAGDPEAGWRTPPNLRVGGDCTITATLVLRKLPKPGGEDGVSVGLAVGTQNLDAPEATLLRQVEPDGREIVRVVEKADPNNGMMMGMMPGMRMRMARFGGNPDEKPEKPPRRTAPAKGQAIKLAVRRVGSNLSYEIVDEVAGQAREIGHLAIGPGDLAGVKVFVSNRNGSEPVEILLQDVTIHAERITGLGTAVRTVRGQTVFGDPTAIDAKTLVVGGPPPAPPKPTGPTPPGAPVTTPASAPPAASPAAPAPPGTVVVTAVLTPAGPVVAGAVPPPAVAPAMAPAAPATPAAAPPQPSAGSPASTPPNQAPATPPKPPEPKAKLPLDEVEAITFERQSMLAAKWHGQPNIDTTRPGGEAAIKETNEEAKAAGKDKAKASGGAAIKKSTEADDLAAPPPGTVPVIPPPKVEAKPNGVRDLHLSLSSLRPVGIRQIMIQCPTDNGQAMWQFNTAGTSNWPLVLARAGIEPWADLFLEPPAGDCHNKSFQITLNYDDGQMANVQVQATDHTDPKAKYDPDSPAPALAARVFLLGDEQLFGRLEAITEQALTLTTPWGDKLDVPLTRVAGVYLGMPDHKESPESFARRLKARGDQDQLLARAKDGEVVAIAGIVEGLKGTRLSFQYQNKTRTLPIKGVEGFTLATRPAPDAPSEVRPTFELAGGIVLSGRWAGIEATAWPVETPWGQTIKLPSADVRSVRFRGGQMAWLSDLTPSSVEEVAYFGRRVPYQKDKTLAGRPLKLDGRTVERGLAVHSRTALTYDLDRRYATFEATVGFEDSEDKRGRVDCRVYADDKEVFANPDLRADAPPVPLKLDVAGAARLKLVVDFGAEEDVGDRVIWADARLYRAGASAAAPAPVPAPASNPAPADRSKP